MAIITKGNDDMTNIKELASKENLESFIAKALELSSIAHDIQNHNEMEDWDADLQDDLVRAKEYAEEVIKTIDVVIEENNETK